MHKEQTIRIIGGKYRSRILFWPNDISIRPTKDKIKEAIFSSLFNINDFTVLDLFSGSGAFGLEALSRGAKKIYFNDFSLVANKCIKENIASLNVDSLCVVDKFEAFQAINYYQQKNSKFDLIFLDPPYEYKHYGELLEEIYKCDILNNNGNIIVEYKFNFEFNKEMFEIIKEKKYGEIKVINLKIRSS